MSAISIRDLNVWFGEGAEQVRAVKGAAFTVAEGERIGKLYRCRIGPGYNVKLV